MQTKFTDRDFRIVVNCLTSANNPLKGAGDVVIYVDSYDKNRAGCVDVRSEFLGDEGILLPVLHEIFDESARAFIEGPLRENPEAIMDCRTTALGAASRYGTPMPVADIDPATPVASTETVHVYRRTRSPG